MTFRTGRRAWRAEPDAVAGCKITHDLELKGVVRHLEAFPRLSGWACPVGPVRLANADTPETGGRARCPEERALGERATAWVRLKVQTREVAVFPIWKLDKYRRALAYVTIDGEDLPSC